jgi:CxxC-x17-CxxC domain-containing protein
LLRHTDLTKTLEKQEEVPHHMSFADKTLTCRDCGQEFAWTAGEQEFYQSRGLQNPPGRCPSCRAERRAQRDSGGYGAGPRQMFSAVCSNCGKEARVPFQPRGDKPVYCSDCFEQRSGRSGGGGGGRARAY